MMKINHFFAFFISITCALYIAFSLYHSETLLFFIKNVFAAYIITTSIFAFLIFFIIKKLYNKNNGISTKINIVFVLAVSLFLFGNLTGINISKDISPKENRNLAKFPKRSPAHQKFPSEFDNFINDRAGFRYEARELFGFLRPYTFSDLNIGSKAIAGKNSWLFDSGVNIVHYYQKLYPYGEKEFNNLKTAIDKAVKFCRENGIKLYFFIPPDKMTLYREFYPDFIKRLNTPEPYDIMRKYIIENSDINFIDTYSALVLEKEKNDLFYKDDTHWNTIGAYIAYKKAAERIKEDFPDFIEVTGDRTYRCTRGKTGELSFYEEGDIGRAMAGYNFTPVELGEICIREPIKTDIVFRKRTQYESIIHQKTANKNGLRIMAFHDSFFWAMRPYFLESASELWSSWTTANNLKVLSLVAYEKEIMDFKPDIIIWENVERFADYMVKDDNIAYKKFNK